MQTVREMADEIIATMMDWDMPKIRGARFDEATGAVVFEIDLAKPLFELRFEVTECIEIGSAKTD